MNKDERIEAEQQQFWQMAIETWQASELSVRQFCCQEGLSEPSFYSWRKKLAKADKAEYDKQEVSGPFIRVSMPGEKQASLELVLSSGNILRIGCGADGQTLSNVISVLKGADLC